jgi:hypothetical protein
MASKTTIKKTVKQLRILLHTLDQSKKATPVVKSLLDSLTKTQTVKFNIPVKFNELGVVFNKVVPLQFNLTTAKATFKVGGGFNLTHRWT